MKHLGDITKLSGFTIPPVDVVTGGSPCQDLSIAGKRAGLAGERSGLFMEQTRIIKEMREADARRGRTADAIRPRWMVWENVAGAFSSHEGEDFRAVLEEIARIADGDAAIPRPAGGKWANAGAVMGDGWSIAWRVHDAQFWGVPQRRRRIAVVADFAGECAGEILFEREGVCGDFTAGGAAGQGAAAGAESGVGEAGMKYASNGSIATDATRSSAVASEMEARQGDSLRATTKRAWTQRERETTFAPTTAHGLKAKANLSFREDADTLICTAFMGGQGVKAGGIGYAEELSPTLKSTASGGNTVLCLCLAGNTIDRQPQNGGNGSGWQEDVSYTLTALDRHAVAYSFDSLASNSMKSANPHSGCRAVEIAKTLDTSPPDPSKNQGGILIMDAVLPFDTTQITSPQNGSSPQYGDPCHPLAAGAHAPAIAVMDARGNGDGAVCPMLTGDHQNRITDYTAIAVDCRNHTTSEVSATLQAKENGGQSLNYINPVAVFSMQRIDEFKPGDVASTQRARQHKDATDGLYVRRLTPTECERLQGYPDGWTDIGAWVKTNKKGKEITVSSADSLRYKALGNSIALPFWRWMLARIMAYYDYPATLGSLFDGIGGFPLCWRQVGGVPVWVSEIEQFPIAVTRKHFTEA